MGPRDAHRHADVAEGVDVDDAGTRTYLPEPERRRAGIALCLSGGGYRAALFHLGALTRLNELGVLGKVDTIASVSGGSILAAHLATVLGTRWPVEGQVVGDWDAVVVAPFLELTATNLRTRPVLSRLLPWNWADRDHAVRALAQAYDERLTRGLPLADLPSTPRFILCATDLTFGVNWVFDSGRGGRMGDYQAGYVRPLPPDLPLGTAVAASSCFPPLFNPLELRLDPDRLTGGRYRGDDRDDLVRALCLSDGGVYDNMALEPVWKDHATVLVSDGGAVFEAESDRGLFWRLSRYTAVAGRQGAAMRKRWLISSFQAEPPILTGTYWGLGSVADHYRPGALGYSAAVIDDVIEEVRTDLDAFSADEQDVLRNHGYLLADAAIQTHAIDLPTEKPPLQVPEPELMDETEVRRALADSSRRRLLGRR